MMPQITSITSEALQATIRRLLPSQQGFGDDLQATNLITPIIDLTPSAEGSEFRQDLQTAASFASQTAISTFNTTNSVVSTPGFWYVKVTFSNGSNSVVLKTADITVTDGTSSKKLYSWRIEANSGAMSQVFDYVIYLNAGESVTQTTDDTSVMLHSCARQIADTNGTLVNPAGFTPQ